MTTYTEDAVIIGELLAKVDLSAAQYCAVALKDTSGTAEWGLPASAGDGAQGFLTNKPTALQAARVQVGGIARAIVASAGITAGAKVQVDTAGHVLLAATGDHVVGIALKTGVDNDIIPVLLVSQFLIP